MVLDSCRVKEEKNVLNFKKEGAINIITQKFNSVECVISVVMMLEIVDIDFKPLWEEMKRLPSFEDQLDFLVSVMVQVMQNVTSVARAYAKVQDGRDRLREEIKSIKKSVDGLTGLGLVRDVLKGQSRNLLWVKEKDILRKLTEGWYIV